MDVELVQRLLSRADVISIDYTQVRLVEDSIGRGEPLLTACNDAEEEYGPEFFIKDLDKTEYDENTGLYTMTDVDGITHKVELLITKRLRPYMLDQPEELM